MLTRNEALWVEYIEIDEDTRERRLKADAPQEIIDEYEKYLLKLKEQDEEICPK